MLKRRADAARNWPFKALTPTCAAMQGNGGRHWFGEHATGKDKFLGPPGSYGGRWQ